jgi:hypothetical protein
LLIGRLGEVMDRIVGGRQPAKYRQARILPPRRVAFGNAGDRQARLLRRASFKLIANASRREIFQQHDEVAVGWIGRAMVQDRNANARARSDVAIEAHLPLVETEHHGKLS